VFDWYQDKNMHTLLETSMSGAIDSAAHTVLDLAPWRYNPPPSPPRVVVLHVLADLGQG